MTTTFSAVPFDHWVIDDFLPPEDAWAAYRHFYEGEGPWTIREHLYCHAKETRTTGLHPEVDRVLTRLEGSSIRHYISRLSGVPDLLSDPDRFGGGQHTIKRDGYLAIHADFTHHPTTGNRRVLNLLLYLNAHWKNGDGGELELWSPDMRQWVVKVAPLFNRAVLFRTSPTSYHGHPEPLEGSERRSLAVYYYVNPYVAQHPPATPYAYVGANNDYLRTTDYQPRPWEYGLRLRKWLSRRIKG